MFTRTFALFLRALRVDARLLHSHLMRLFLLSFVGATLMIVHVFFSPVMGAPGLWFFQFISWINYGFATLAAGFLFAAAITEEKEERTLGLLRMANVGPLSLLVGKAAPRLVAAVLILCVQFPFTLLAITLGGISWDQVIAAFCTLLAHVVLVGSLALLFSVMFRKTGTAIALTLAVILCEIVVPPFLKWAFTMGTPPYWMQPLLPYVLPVLETVVDASAAPRLWEILMTGFNDGPLGFQVLSNLAAGALLFGLAWLLFDPFNRNPDDEVRGGGSWAALLGRRKGRSRRAWRLAIVGKDFRAQAGGWIAMLAKLTAYLAFFLLISWAVNDFSLARVGGDEVGGLMAGLVFYLLLPLELMLLAARLFRAEIKDRTWPLLLSLPLSLPEVAYAKLAGAFCAIVPCLFYFCLGVALDAADFAEFLEEMIEEPNMFLLRLLYCAHLLMFVHLTALFSVLSNAWAGALLAIVTVILGAFANTFLVNLPILLIQLSGGRMMSPDTEELYYLFALALSLAVVLTISFCLHYMIGVRLKSSAAQ